MLDTHRPSALELDLKRIIRAHPEAAVRHESPSGPFVRAVLWGAGEGGQIIGQALWDTDTNRWVVRAFDTTIGDSSLVVTNPATKEQIHDAITDVIEQIQNPGLFALDTVAPELAGVVRSLRGEA